MGTKMSKKSVVTITVMACLLAVAVATTIVLAAFTANKTATTTVTFSNGVQLKITGAFKTTSNAGDADPISQTSAVTLLWGCTEGTTAHRDSATVTNVSQNITFDPITFVNGNSSQSTTAWLIAKATITSSNVAHQKAVIITRAGTWTQIGTTDWYAYGSTTSGTVTIAGTPSGGSNESTSIAFTTVPVDAGDHEGDVPFITAASITPANMKTNDPTTYAETDPTIDDLAGASFTATVSVYAVNAGAADAASVLSGIVYP